MINYYRTSTVSNLDVETKSSSKADEDYTIVDVELNENQAEDEKSSDLRYVYDLYYTTSDDLGDADFNECIRLVILLDHYLDEEPNFIVISATKRILIKHSSLLSRPCKYYSCRTIIAFFS